MEGSSTITLIIVLFALYVIGWGMGYATCYFTVRLKLASALEGARRRKRVKDLYGNRD
jgi:hypothetical protein